METPLERLNRSITLREQLAQHYLSIPLPTHISNGDDQRFATENYFASYTKGLPHHAPLGEVDSAAYRSLLRALDRGSPADFASVPLGWPSTSPRQPLTDPQAGLAFDLEGIDSHSLTIPPSYSRSE